MILKIKGHKYGFDRWTCGEKNLPINGLEWSSHGLTRKLMRQFTAGNGSTVGTILKNWSMKLLLVVLLKVMMNFKHEINEGQYLDRKNIENYGQKVLWSFKLSSKNRSERWNYLREVQGVEKVVRSCSKVEGIKWEQRNTVILNFNCYLAPKFEKKNEACRGNSELLELLHDCFSLKVCITSPVSTASWWKFFSDSELESCNPKSIQLF